MKLMVLICGLSNLSGVLAADGGFTLSWTNNLLTVSNANLPGGKLEIWYPEAFCKKGSTDRDWGETALAQKTIQASGSPLGVIGSSNRRIDLTPNSRSLLTFQTTIQPNVVLLHAVSLDVDCLTILFQFSNGGIAPVDLDWFQPACIRVDKFTGCNQSNYTSKSFIFTERGLTTLDKTARRSENEARYHGGQVYVPKGVNLADVNPRPICHDLPTNGLIGCFSADGKYLLATASDNTHELFEGVYVCLHSDPHVGGLAPGQTKTIRSKIYFMTNDVNALLKRYQADFPADKRPKSPAGF
jgi:hypothetical protein